MSNHAKFDGKEVVVIGGRACGIAAIVHLMDTLPSGSRTTIVDPKNQEYPSVFDDIDPLLLANTSHEMNSLFPDRPADFLEFLDESDRLRSVPRNIVGKYCRARLAEACEKSASCGIEVRQIVGYVRSAIAKPDGYSLLLEDGSEIPASDVVIAVGLGEVQQPTGLSGVPPYPSTRLRQRAGRHALVIGQGQSGLDAALVLCAAGSRVTMCSRSGRFPAVRTRTPLNKYMGSQITDSVANFRRMVDEDCRRRGHPPLNAQLLPIMDPLSMLREEIRLAEQDQCPWQDSIVGVISAIVDAGVSVSKDREFLWRYVTAVDLTIAQRLLAHIDQGHIVLAEIGSIDVDQFDLVVTATGFSPPPLHHQGRTLHFGNPSPKLSPVTNLSSELRLILSEAHGAERIWAIGPASGIRVPFANFLHIAARQALQVAKQINGIISRTA